MTHSLSTRIAFFLLANMFFFLSCGDGDENNNNPKPSVTMSNNSHAISQEKFGNIGGHDITKYTMTNPAGMRVSIINYGGTITNIFVPDTAGKWADVVLGFDDLKGYLQPTNPYFGTLVGRFANRIANAKFTLNGKVYQLAANNNGNALHGGIRGFSKVAWTATPLPGDTSLKFTYFSRDGEEGYPGNCSVQVVYTLTPGNELKIDYTATTDKGTPINLTNHSYFNLSAGRDSTILGHEVMINADKYTVVNDKLIPTGKLAPVKGTAMDFNVPAKVGTDIEKTAGGYDHNYVLNKKSPKALEFAASVYDAGSGRYLEVYTTQPGIQFYTGNFLDGTLTGKQHTRYVKNGGLCLETQHFPDSPNQPSFPSAILRPGETFHETTVFKFSTK